MTTPRAASVAEAAGGREYDPLAGLITSSALASFVVAALAVVLAELAR